MRKCPRPETVLGETSGKSDFVAWNHLARFAMSFKKKTLILNHIPLFSSLPASGIHYLAKTLDQVDLPAGTVLFNEGDMGDKFYIVLEGQVDIIKGMGTDEERTISTRGPGECVGEMSFFLPSGRRTASVRTVTDVQLLQITLECLDTLLRKWPSFGVETSRILSLRLLESDNARIAEIQDHKKKVSRIFTDLHTNLARKPGETEVFSGQEDENFQLISEFVKHEEILIEKMDSIGADEGISQIKRAIHRSKVPRLQIKTLGNFQVFRNGKIIEETHWQAKQPKLLLKAIVARRSCGIPKDVLIEDLWPDITAEAGERNFKVILHRLRNILEPSLVKDFGSSYVHLKSGLIYLDEELVSVDLEELLSLISVGEEKQGHGDPNSALIAYEEAIGLYGGDFLAEDLYMPWAEMKRTEIRNKVINVLFRIAELQEKKRNLKSASERYQKIIELDSTVEQAYQQLMLNYSNRGMRSAAIRVYQDCCQALQRELDMKPDRLTTSIYRKILETP